MSLNGATAGEPAFQPGPTNPVVIIGLDGATFDLIHPWAEQGHLPNLARLMSQGAWGNLKSTEPPISAVAWASFSTGTHPGRHGVYYFVGPSYDKGRFRPVTALSIKNRRLWQLVGDQGGRVGTMNIPMSYPPVPVNGYLIGDFYAPDDRSAFDDPALYDEVIRECGAYRSEVFGKSDRQAFFKDILETIDIQTKVGCYLLERHPVDMYAMVYTVLDRAQHSFWADMDEHHPLHKKLGNRRIPDALFQVYQRLDNAIGQLLEKVPANATVIVMSDHGFLGEYYRFAANTWLQELGLLQLSTGRQVASGVGRLRVFIKRAGLRKLAQSVLRRLVGTWRQETLYYRLIDWPNTKVSYGPGWGFYVNLKGRDFEGSTDPSEYEAVRDKVIKALKALRAPNTGLPVVSDVFRREELYSGEELESAPDIVPVRAEYVTNGRRWDYGLSKGLGTAGLFMDPTSISGNHAQEGIFIASGPNVRSGQVDGLHIVDMVPTTMYALGLNVPGGLDGVVRTELFTPGHVEANPVRFADIDVNQDLGSDSGLSADNAALVEQRLKDLGYL